MAKVKIDKEMYRKIKEISNEAGYSSVDEFVHHLLEKVIRDNEPEERDEDVLNRLKGLGYIS